MSNIKTKTRDVSGFADFITGTKTHEAEASDGKSIEKSRAGNPEQARKQATEKLKNK